MGSSWPVDCSAVATMRVHLTGLSLFALTCAGCADKEAQDPGAIVREEVVQRVGPPSRATSRTVRCGCDADGDLHVSAPHGSQVTVPEDATHPAEAQIVLPDDRPAVRLRQTKSLGFIGDGKLTPAPSRGGPWNVPDALLPPHRHVEPRYSSYYGYGYAPRVSVPGHVVVPARYGGWGAPPVSVPAPPPPGWR